MVALSDLLDVCPNGAWVTEDQAVEVLGLESKAVLKERFNDGSLPHVIVEHGARVRAPAPYNSHAFFFVQSEGSSGTTPYISLLQWVKICQGDPSDSETADAILKYSNLQDAEEAFKKLKMSSAIATSLAPGNAGSGDYRYGTSGGPRPSREGEGGDDEIYTRPDGTRVRRIKRASSAAPNPTSLDGFFSSVPSKVQAPRGSKSVAGDGEVYVRADGKKVRRVKRSSCSVASEDPSKKTLDGFLGSSGSGKSKVGGSASVAGDQLALTKESSLTGEVYVRADGKKVRRVKKSLASAGTPADSNVEIIIRPDGTKVRRIRKTKAPEASLDPEAPTSGDSVTSPSLQATNPGLAGFLDPDPTEPITKFSGSHSVAGDQPFEGEIYVRPDGKKVRRVRKPGSVGSPSISRLDVADEAFAEDADVEIYTRPDGTKVRRIKKTASQKPAPEQPVAQGPAPGAASKTLDGFLLGKTGGIRPKIGGSASVAGDRIAVSKDESLTGEVYVRADGKKVRRVKKSPAGLGDNVEIITRPDGTKVRRIRKTKPKAESIESDPLSGFLESQPKSAPKGGAATVGGDVTTARMSEPVNDAAAKEAQAKRNLDKFLSSMDSRPKKVGGSASVAGDMLAVDKNSSLTGEVYVRSDGKKVRRVKKISAAQPGDEVEIITRPDGTKVRRIRRARKPQEEEAEEEPGKLEGFLGSPSGTLRLSGSASVTGDILHSQDAQGEIYVRADGKKVRRIRKSAPSATGLSSEQYEIYVRPDGKKVRRIRRTKPSTQPGGGSPSSSPPEDQSSSDNQTNGTLIPGASPLSAEDGALARDMVNAGISGSSVIPEMATADNEVAHDSQVSIIDRELRAPTSETNAGSKVSSLSLSEEEVASQYQKMLKMGMPDGAVMQKMAVDGIAQNIQDFVLARQVPASVNIGSATSLAEKVSLLSSDEEMIASHYRKMLKMGMPDGAVMQKMAVDGVERKIQDSVLAHEIPASADNDAQTSPIANVSSLSADEEEVASHYRKMLKMGMPEGAVAQKMSVDGVAQNVQDSVLSNEIPASPSRDTFSQDQARVPEGMVLVPQDQAAPNIPEGMVAVPKEKAGGGHIPEGYVLVPKDQVRGDPVKDDLVLVKRDQVNSNAQVVLISEPNEIGLKKNDELDDDDRAAIEGANIVDFDDLPSKVEMMKQGNHGKKPRFLLQALPDDQDLEQDFIRKNLLPKGASAASPERAPTKAPAPAAPSSSIAELLAQMSTMGGDFDAVKMGELLQKLESAEKRQKKLEKQLAQAGVAIAEDIDYEICLKKVAEIGKRMGEIGGSDVTHPDKEEQNRLREEYFKLEQEMEKYNNALLLTDEYQAEQDRLEKKWEEDNAPGNLEALKMLRRHMPVEVRNMSEAQLTTEATPNGKYLPMVIAKKFKRTNVLQIIRRDPDDIVRMHPSTLENMRVTGLTLSERRAIYEHLRGVGPVWKAGKAEKMTERKWTWYNMMKGNFKENLASWQRHVDQYGPPGAHPYATRANPNEGCPLIGKQCPLKADKLIDYDNDYGFPDGPVYEVSDVKKADADDPGAKAMQEALELMKEKKANERSDALKKHYQGKLLQVSKANGSCEQMDDMMDKIEFSLAKWLEDIILLGDDKSKLTDDVTKKEVANFTEVLNDCKLSILDICGRSGMQLSGKKGGDGKPDIRSILECSLAEETAEAFDIFTKFINNRLKQTGVLDTRIKSTVDMLNGLLAELRERNLKTISSLGGERLPLSRKLKTQEVLEKEIKEKIAARVAEEAQAGSGEESAGGAGSPPLPGPPRGGLLDAIKGGRGRGGGGGRGSLLDAIKGGGGRGGGGRGGLLDAIKGGGGRGGLLDAIKGGGGRGGSGGGRGGLLDAIKAGRGRGRGGGSGDGGGRGDLLSAIQGRGRGASPGGDSGGRGGLLAAIQARGGA